ncbi:response regulator transcription factor [Pseudomonas sp. S 311-6]|nr:response regulator transcription factor [Pseudomonas sp. S 311-6]
MHTRPRILIVDDHQSIREPLSAYLRRFDFDVEAVNDGWAMREILQARAFDLIVLDVMMPGEDGLSLCRYTSERLGIPIILLTAVTEQADRIAGLEAGADDYVVKPFDPRELVARIRSILRRSQARRPALVHAPGNDVPQQGKCFRFDGWVFDPGRRELRNPAGAQVVLSTAEFHLLRVFVENANRVLSRTQLLDLTQRADNVTFDRSIDSQVSRLRKKLESDPKHPSLLKTVRGDGYLLTANVTMTRA